MYFPYLDTDDCRARRAIACLTLAPLFGRAVHLEKCISFFLSPSKGMDPFSIGGHLLMATGYGLFLQPGRFLQAGKGQIFPLCRQPIY